MHATRWAFPATRQQSSMTHIKGFLWRGALAGLVAGVFGAIFQWTVTESQIRKALAGEAAAAGHSHDEMFSRTTQLLGGMFGNVIYGVLMGLIFAIVLAKLALVLTGSAWFNRTIRLSVAAFVVLVLVPALKYPPNPPSVGNPDTIGQRTSSYLALMVVSVVLAYLALQLWKRLTSRGVLPGIRFAVVAGAYLSAITLTLLLFPASPDPIDAPANLIWHFRLDSLAGNAIIWLTIGTVTGILADRGAPATTPVADKMSAVA